MSPRPCEDESSSLTVKTKTIRAVVGPAEMAVTQNIQCCVDDVSGPGCPSPIFPLPVLRTIRHVRCPQAWWSSEQFYYQGSEEDQPSGGRASKDGGNSLQPDASGAMVEVRPSVHHTRFPQARRSSEQSCYEVSKDGGNSLKPDASGGVIEAVTTN